MSYKSLEKEKYKLEELEFDLPADYTKLSCPSCGSGIPADDININDKIAKCGQCNAIFPFQKEIESLLAPDVTKQEVIRPEGIDIFRFRDSLELTVKQPLTVLETIVISLASALIFPIMIGLVEGMVVLAIGGILAALGIIAYSIIQHYRHKIYLTINQRFLTVKWKPRKHIKEKTYPVEDIDQIYLKSTSTGLAVIAIVNSLNGQKHIKIIPKVSSISKGKYLEQEIEKYLGIKDRRIPDEYTT